MALAGHYTGWGKNRTCLSVDNSATVTRRKACDMSKVLECCRQKGPNLHKSSLTLKLGICLHSRVPEFIELKNLLPKSLDINSVNYSVWGDCNRWHSHKISVTDQLVPRQITHPHFQEQIQIVGNVGNERK